MDAQNCDFDLISYAHTDQVIKIEFQKRFFFENNSNFLLPFFISTFLGHNVCLG